MRLRGIDHIQLAMPRGREDEARSFYEGILGIPEVQKPANLAKRGGCWFDRDALKIHLRVEDDFRPAHKAQRALSRRNMWAYSPAGSAKLEENLLMQGTTIWRTTGPLFLQECRELR